MYNLDKKTEINVKIDKSKLFMNFDFHFSRKEKIERIVKNLIITNQIETKKYIKNENNKIIKKYKKNIYFINITMFDFSKINLFDITEYMYLNMSLLVDIYKKINRDVFLSVVDTDGFPGIILYKVNDIFEYMQIPIDFCINIDEIDDFSIVYNGIISQIENAGMQDEILKDDIIENYDKIKVYDGIEVYDKMTYDETEEQFYQDSIELKYWYMINNGIYPDDDLNLLTCDEYLLNF